MADVESEKDDDDDDDSDTQSSDDSVKCAHPTRQIAAHCALTRLGRHSPTSANTTDADIADTASLPGAWLATITAAPCPTSLKNAPPFTFLDMCEADAFGSPDWHPPTKRGQKDDASMLGQLLQGGYASEKSADDVIDAIFYRLSETGHEKVDTGRGEKDASKNEQDDEELRALLYNRIDCESARHLHKPAA